MKPKLIAAIAIGAILVSACQKVDADTLMISPLKEYRYCHAEPLRTKDGKILRRRDVLEAFQRIHPCPSTGNVTGTCPYWYLNHVIPLANGGCDAVFNLQWMPAEIKSCAGDYCEDRFERKIYGRTYVPGVPLYVLPEHSSPTSQ